MLDLDLPHGFRTGQFLGRHHADDGECGPQKRKRAALNNRQTVTQRGLLDQGADPGSKKDG